MEPWAHGTVLRATRFPTYWDFNALRLEGPVPEDLSAEVLAAQANEHLAGLDHRKVEIEDDASGAALAAGLGALGWHTERLVALRRDGTQPAEAVPDFAELPPEAKADLETAWLLEEKVMPDAPTIRAFLVEQDDARSRLPGTVSVLGEPGTAYVSLRLDGAGGEIEDAYVTPAARGRGLGTGLLHGAMARAREAGVRDLWILADADGRPRRLYERLGFRAAWTHRECVRRPARAVPPARSPAPG